MTSGHVGSVLPPDESGHRLVRATIVLFMNFLPRIGARSGALR